MVPLNKAFWVSIERERTQNSKSRFPSKEPKLSKKTLCLLLRIIELEIFIIWIYENVLASSSLKHVTTVKAITLFDSKQKKRSVV